MAGHKRRLDDGTSAQKSKKSKLSFEKPEAKNHKRNPVPSTSAVTLDEIDFPRGGGTTLTPLEVKTTRAEAVREADQELFTVSGPIVVKDGLMSPGLQSKPKVDANIASLMPREKLQRW